VCWDSHHKCDGGVAHNPGKVGVWLHWYDTATTVVDGNITQGNVVADELA